MTTMTQPQTNPRTSPTDLTPDASVEAHLSERRINQNLASLHVEVKQPQFRTMVRDAVVQSSGIELAKDRRTDPSLKIDVHPLIEKMKENRKAIKGLIDANTVNDFSKGFHLVAWSRLPRVLQELTRLKQERRDLARRFAEQWPTFLATLQEIFPAHYEMIRSKLPDPEQVPERFEVHFKVMRLSPVETGDLDLRDLSPEAVARVQREIEEQILKEARQRAQRLFNDVFMEVYDVANEIVEDPDAFGNRRGGAIDSYLRVLDRVQAFSEFTSSDVLARIQAARRTLARVSNIEDWNQNEQTQAAVREAMRPLRETMAHFRREHEPGGGRAGRRIRL